jgi:hypothetical protein
VDEVGGAVANLQISQSPHFLISQPLPKHDPMSIDRLYPKLPLSPGLIADFMADFDAFGFVFCI